MLEALGTGKGGHVNFFEEKHATGNPGTGKRVKNKRKLGQKPRAHAQKSCRGLRRAVHLVPLRLQENSARNCGARVPRTAETADFRT